MTRVVTLTPAPSLDRVYAVDALGIGGVNRAFRSEVHLGGNGVNLARNLHVAGHDVAAVVPLDARTTQGRCAGDTMYDVVAVAHPTRVNTVIVTPDGLTTNVNQSPQPLSAREWDSLERAVSAQAARIQPDWIVLGGSLPGGNATVCRENAVRLREIARAHHARLVVDSPGEVLAEWLAVGVVPHLASPNWSELGAATGTDIRTLGDAVDAAERLIDCGVGAVMVSLGPLGALLVTVSGHLWARAAPTRVVNTTGAGDAALAGLVARWRGQASGGVAEDALARAVRWGRTAVQYVSPTIRVEDIERTAVDIDDPRRSCALR